jgi:uncharacterized protein
VIGAPEITAETLEELNEFLLSDRTPDDCMQISDLDGLLTGVVVGPETIMPSEWMAAIWQGGEPQFKDPEQAEHILGIIMARYNEIIHQLDDEPGAFEPIFYQAPDGDMLVTDWAEGFMYAYRLRVDSWNPMFEDKDSRTLLAPIMAHLYDNDGKPFIEGSPEELQEIRDECAEVLPLAVKGIHDFWKARRQPSNFATKRSAPKVGRNDPCPCGSGRKYKRCCGAN